MPIAEKLYAAMTAAGIPIVGVSIGRTDDKATWRVDYADGAGADAKTAAAAVIAAFDGVKADEPPPRHLSKVTILDRLNAVGLVKQAFDAMGGPGSYVYERWQAAGDMIDITHPLVVQVLDAIGADKAAILKP